MRWKPSFASFFHHVPENIDPHRGGKKINSEHITRKEKKTGTLCPFHPSPMKILSFSDMRSCLSIVFTRYKLIDICIMCLINMRFIATHLVCLMLLILPPLGQGPKNSGIHLWFYACIGNQVLSECLFRCLFFKS